MKIGAQLFTVREYCKDLESFAETLKRVADIGYKTVQVSGVCAYEPAWLRDELQKNGLECVLTHIPPERIVDETQQVIADHNVFGCNYIGIGYCDIHKTGVQAFIDRFKAAGEAIHAAGKQLCYHNHDHEFIKIDGETIYKQITDGLTPEQMAFTLDTYWVQAGGADPIWWIRHLKDRVPCVHLKDMAYGKKMAALGTGNLNLDGVLAACADANSKYLLVEQDDCYGEDPFACLQTSYAFLQSRGLA